MFIFLFVWNTSVPSSVTHLAKSVFVVVVVNDPFIVEMLTFYCKPFPVVIESFVPIRLRLAVLTLRHPMIRLVLETFLSLYQRHRERILSTRQKTTVFFVLTYLLKPLWRIQYWLRVTLNRLTYFVQYRRASCEAFSLKLSTPSLKMRTLYKSNKWLQKELETSSWQFRWNW